MLCGNAQQESEYCTFCKFVVCAVNFPRSIILFYTGALSCLSLVSVNVFMCIISGTCVNFNGVPFVLGR